jgi:hypothetical protein
LSPKAEKGRQESPFFTFAGYDFGMFLFDTGPPGTWGRRRKTGRIQGILLITRLGE